MQSTVSYRVRQLTRSLKIGIIPLLVVVGMLAILVASPARTAEATSYVAPVNVTVANTGTEAIWYLYISPTTDRYWGEDWLGTEILWPGDTMSFDVVPGRYDLMLETVDGERVYQWDVSIYNDFHWVVDTVRDAVTLTIVNMQPETIYYAYVSPTTSAYWGSDMLGYETLASGESLAVSVAPDRYDLLAEGGWGISYIEWDMPLYDDDTWVLGADENA
jgi:hypothetical protein